MIQKYKDCSYCGYKMIKEPIIDTHQGNYSLLCPYCLVYRSEWKPTVQEAIEEWNS